MKSRKKVGIQLLGTGNNVRIFSFINDRGDDVPKQYIDHLNEKEESKLINLFEFMLSQGNIYNEEKFKQLSDDIFEFKSDSHRILCFIIDGLRPKSFVLTHGFKKEKGKTPRKEIKKAVNIKNTIFELYKSGKLKVVVSKVI